MYSLKIKPTILLPGTIQSIRPRLNLIAYIVMVFCFLRMKEHTVTVNDVSIGLPYKRNGVIIRQVTNVWMRLTHDSGVEVLWDGAQRVEIILPSKFRNKASINRFPSTYHVID